MKVYMLRSELHFTSKIMALTVPKFTCSLAYKSLFTGCEKQSLMVTIAAYLSIMYEQFRKPGWL